MSPYWAPVLAARRSPRSSPAAAVRWPSSIAIRFRATSCAASFSRTTRCQSSSSSASIFMIHRRSLDAASSAAGGNTNLNFRRLRAASLACCSTTFCFVMQSRPARSRLMRALPSQRRATAFKPIERRSPRGWWWVRGGGGGGSTSSSTANSFAIARIATSASNAITSRVAGGGWWMVG